MAGLCSRDLLYEHTMAFSHFLLWKLCVTKNALFQLLVGVQFKDINHVHTVA